MQSRPSTAFLLLFVASLFLIYNSAYVLNQTETALVTQFGNPVSVETEPGLHVKLPFLQSVEYFDKRLLSYEMPGEININASDQKRISVGAFLRWRIVDPLAFAEATRRAGIGGDRISGMRTQLDSWLDSSLRQIIGGVPLTALLTPERDDVMSRIRDRMREQASGSGSSAPGGKTGGDSHAGFGIEIVDVRIVKLDLPPENSDAVFNRMKAERTREAMSYRAKGDQESQTIRAHADYKRTVLLAEAHREAEKLRGDGDATAGKILADAYQQDPEFFEFYRSLQAYRKAFSSKDTSMVLTPDDPFLRAFRTGAGR